MKWRQWVFRILGYAGTLAVPVLAATGIGIPAAIVAAAATVGGGLLHLANPPKWSKPEPSEPGP
jgi:hypothetical protein